MRRSVRSNDHRPERRLIVGEIPLVANGGRGGSAAGRAARRAFDAFLLGNDGAAPTAILNIE